jgi:hypothetical protein
MITHHALVWFIEEPLQSLYHVMSDCLQASFLMFTYTISFIQWTVHDVFIINHEAVETQQPHDLLSCSRVDIHDQFAINQCAP